MKRTIGMILAVLLIFGGGWQVYRSLNKKVEPVPAPPSNYSVSDSIPTSGPDSGVVKVVKPKGNKDEPSNFTNPGDEELGPGFTMNPEDMRKNRVYVPSIGAYGPIETHGIDNKMLVLNENPFYVTQYRKGGTVTSKEGTLLLAGHVSYNTLHGTFHDLAYIKPGEVAYVTDEKGNRAKFKATKIAVFGKTDVERGYTYINGKKEPLNLYTSKGPKRLVLVTCGGEVVQTSHGRIWSDNVVVTMVPA